MATERTDEGAGRKEAKRDLRFEVERRLVTLLVEDLKLLAMHDNEGQTWSDICRKMRIPVGSIGVRISRAQAAIRAAAEKTADAALDETVASGTDIDPEVRADVLGQHTRSDAVKQLDHRPEFVISDPEPSAIAFEPDTSTHGLVSLTGEIDLKRLSATNGLDEIARVEDSGVRPEFDAACDDIGAVLSNYPDDAFDLEDDSAFFEIWEHAADYGSVLNVPASEIASENSIIATRRSSTFVQRLVLWNMGTSLLTSFAAFSFMTIFSYFNWTLARSAVFCAFSVFVIWFFMWALFHMKMSRT